MIRSAYYGVKYYAMAKSRTKTALTPLENSADDSKPLGWPPFLNNSSLQILIICVTAILVYSNTMSVPLQWDDTYNISENPLVHDLKYFTNIRDAEAFVHYKNFFLSRYVGYLSLALNYKAGGLSLKGYHAVNILIHIINALLLYYIVSRTLRTERWGNFAGFFAGLIFAVHPVQTQAVTYIIQRLASLATMFCLISFGLYIKSSSSNNTRRRIVYYVLAVVSAVAAMKTKEIAFTLPILLLLYDWTFFKRTTKDRILRLLPFLLTMLIIPITLLIDGRSAGEAIGEVGKTTRLLTPLSRGDYLTTEFAVVGTYIRLLLLPVNQNADYDYPVYQSIFNLNVLLPLMLIAGLAAFGVYLINKGSSRASKLAGFGLLWFFIALSVESSLIPIADVIFEHRLYLPSAGFISAFVAGAFILADKYDDKKLVVIAILAVSLIFGVATYKRNAVWQSEVSLWEDVATKSPAKPRGYYNLGVMYMNRGEHDRAIDSFLKSLELKPEAPDVLNNLGLAYSSKGMNDLALKSYALALSFNPNMPEAYANMGLVYEAEGNLDMAISSFEKAVAIDPEFAEGYYSLGNYYDTKGDLSKASESYNKAIELKPYYAAAHNNLGIVYLKQGLREKAMGMFQEALKLDPNYEDARTNLKLALTGEGRLR